MDIRDKRVVITGSNRGLGRALALACLRAGAREVVAGAREVSSLASLQTEAGELGARLVPVRLDVRVQTEIDDVARLGRADVLINNAGMAAFGGVLGADFAAIEDEVQVNYLGILRMVRALAPVMVAHGDGLIVNVASALGKVNLPVVGTYSALKAALLSLGHGLRGELQSRGVRVVTVCPATLDTDMTKDFPTAKMPTALAAREILEAILQEPVEVAIGDEARGMFAEFERDARALQNAFLQSRF
jgi:NAD(P)-dependent dehydrogenase (short-subunit alcohol dehydrogenase family)